MAETSYWFLKQKFIGLCTLPAVVTPELHPPAPAHLRGLPFTSFCTCYQTPHSDQVALNEGKKGEEVVRTKWPTLWKKKANPSGV